MTHEFNNDSNQVEREKRLSGLTLIFSLPEHKLKPIKMVGVSRKRSQRTVNQPFPLTRHCPLLRRGLQGSIKTSSLH